MLFNYLSNQNVTLEQLIGTTMALLVSDEESETGRVHTIIYSGHDNYGMDERVEINLYF